MKSGLFYTDVYLKLPITKIVAGIFLYRVAGMFCTLEMEDLQASKDISGYGRNLYFGDMDPHHTSEKAAMKKEKKQGTVYKTHD